jgi:hypothetical protein
MFAWGDLTLVDVLLGFGLIVVVPLAFGLDHRTAKLTRVGTAAGCLATTGLALRRGTPMAIVLGFPWLAITVAAELPVARHWWRERPTWAATAPVVTFADLVFAAAWLLLELAGTRPFGVAPPFVELAAVHFTYAGFTAGLLVTVAARRCAAGRPLQVTVMVALVLLGPPVVAVGFRLAPPLQVLGASMLTVGLCLLSWQTARTVIPTGGDRLAAALLGVSSAAVIVPMLLAVWWAVGRTAALPAPSVSVMAPTHGLANAVGFAFLGVVGWRRLDRTELVTRVDQMPIPDTGCGA